MKSLKFAHSFEVVADLPEALQPLQKLAYNLHWTWDTETRNLFRETDRTLWANVGHNPVQLINRLSPERIERLTHDHVYLARLKRCEECLDEYLGAETQFARAHPEHREDCYAYFCAEFGITESLPIYSGGLGVLAGDHLKAASDLGIPLVGVGLLYSRGYFRQSLTHDGWQQEVYPEYDFYQMPLQLCRQDDRQPIRIGVEFPDRTVTCQVWKAQVGRIPLYLLDSNVLENQANDQGITDTLYGGDDDMRIRQEMILGIGGFRALQALGIKPTVCHMNEGHAAFLAMERIRQFMVDTGSDSRIARQVTVAGNVFTTHTPVPAGFDLFDAPMLKRYMEKAVSATGMPFDDFLKLGRIDPNDTNEKFNMAVLAMENANHVNGVSQLHASVSRGMFNARWPQMPVDEVPVTAITNGIHTMTWLSRRMGDLFDGHFGVEWRQDASNPDIWKRIEEIPDGELWELRENQRGDFIRFCRKRVQQQWTRRAKSRDLGVTGGVLDPRVLTIGFARRFATYKRATLLFTDKERLKSLLFHPERPVQFVFAGKSHPRDDGGKRLIQEIVQFIENEGASHRMVFLEDYDMEVARNLVQGVDVWLNNPRRPLEASGTSGMKVVPNGGLNCSILDGWWAEAYRPGLGWSIGDGEGVDDVAHHDWLDSLSLYQVLEQEIAPTFYHRVDGSIPVRWVEMMKKSMAQLAPQFSTARMVAEYASRFYTEASVSYANLEADHQAKAKAALEWRTRIRSAWPELAICEVTDTAAAVNSIGDSYTIRVVANLGNLSQEDVSAQALIGSIGGNRSLHNVELHELALESQDGGRCVFSGTFECGSHGHRGYTIRIVPRHPDVDVIHELPLVCWEPVS